MRASGVAVCFVAIIASPLEGQATPIFAGVLNGWGVAIPEVIYADGTWRRVMGPEAFEEEYGAVRGDDRYRWTLHLGPGLDRMLEGGPIVRFTDPFLAEWGFITDFPAISAHPQRQPRIVGPIVSYPQEFVGISEVSQANPGRQSAVEALSTLVQGWNGSPPVVIEDFYWISGRNLSESWVYYRAERWMDEPTNCPAVEVFEGWLRAPMGTATLELASRGITDCELKTVEILRPLGLLELGQRSFVVVDVSEWESREIDIVELSSDGATRLLRNSRRPG